MSRRYVAFLCLGAALLGTRTATSTTLVPLSFNQIVAGAETIFLGETIARRSEWDLGPHRRSIVTYVTFKVERVLKGQVGSQVELRFRGGKIGHQVMRISGMPEFVVGDRDVLFVASERRTPSPLVGFAHGRFQVVRDLFSRTEEVRGPDGRGLMRSASVKEPIVGLRAGQVTRSLSYAEFEAIVRDTIARGAP